jgi:hypothetical protein
VDGVDGGLQGWEEFGARSRELATVLEIEHQSCSTYKRKTAGPSEGETKAQIATGSPDLDWARAPVVPRKSPDQRCVANPGACLRASQRWASS